MTYWGVSEPTKKMTEEKILLICKKQGHFDISLKWRYDFLRRLMSKLINKKLMKIKGRVGRSIRYVLKENEVKNGKQ